MTGFGFPASEQAAAWTLALELRYQCGSIDRGGNISYELIPDPSGWRTLRECTARQLAEAVRRTQRSCPDWRLPGSDAQPIHSRIEHYFAAARSGR